MTNSTDEKGSTRLAYYWLALLASVSFFNYLDRMVIAVLAEPIKADLELTDTQLGLVSGFAFAVLYSLTGIPLARIADRGSRVSLLAACLGFWSLMTALSGMARNMTELFLARMGVGIGEAGCVPTAHSLIGDYFPPERRAFAIGLFQSGGQIGLTLGLALAGWAGQEFGWRAAVIGCGLLGLPVTLLTLFTMREPRRNRPTPLPTETVISVLKALAGRATFVHLVVGLTIGSFTAFGVTQWLAAFYMRSHGLSLVEVGGYGALAGGLGGIFGAILGGLVLSVARKRDARWEYWGPMAGYTLSAPAFALVFLVPGYGAAFGLQFVGAILLSAATTTALSSLQTPVEPHRRATAIALALLISTLAGLGLGPTVIGAVSDSLAPRLGVDSLRGALLASTVLLLWAAAHFWLAAGASARAGVEGAAGSAP
ncbi:MAG: MFS transporter [Alphaproteobacteria bacterium]|nr:MFS transporter [Alphaproteobacteria bacterium]